MSKTLNPMFFWKAKWALPDFQWTWRQASVKEIAGFLPILSQNIIVRSSWTNFFLFWFRKHKDIDRWIILAQILFLLNIHSFGSRKITPQHSDLGSQDTCTVMHWGRNTQFLSWEAEFNSLINISSEKKWHSSGCFHSKASSKLLR